MKKFSIFFLFIWVVCWGWSVVAKAMDLGVPPLKIGVYDCLSGPNAMNGLLEVEGIRLAHREAPAVLGRPVELIIMDTQNQAAETAQVVEELITRNKVSALIGTYTSSMAMVGGAISERSGIPMVGTSCTNPLVTYDKKYCFRVSFIDSDQGLAAAEYAFKTLGARKAAILLDSDVDYSVGLAGFFEKSFKRLGGLVTVRLHYHNGDTDFNDLLEAVMAQKPDILFAPSYFSEGVLIAMQARALGADFVIMGGDAMDNPLLTSFGAALEGFVHTTFAYANFMPDMNEQARTFTKNWAAVNPKIFGRQNMPPNANAAMGYDAYKMLIQAIARAGSDQPEAIAAALAETRDFSAVTGLLTLDKNHNPHPPVGFITIKDGREVFLGTVNAQ